MKVSSLSLFHYTKSLESLCSILKEGFYASFSKEFIMSNGGFYSYAVPIISFCDIPLSQIKEHINKYGNYAVGVTKDYASNNGLNPVWYLENLSIANEGLFKIHRYVLSNFSAMVGHDGFNLLNEGLIAILQTIKNHTGFIMKEGKAIPMEFYKEKEWRYTPLLDIAEQQMYPEQDYHLIAAKYPSKPHLKNVNLPLTFNDLSYIIVNSDEEVIEIMEHLKLATNLYSTDDEYKLLLTKIITIKQIERDF